MMIINKYRLFYHELDQDRVDQSLRAERAEGARPKERG